VKVSRIRIFSSRDEFLNLSWPIVLLLFIALEMIFFKGMIEQKWLLAVGGILFLDSGHAALSFLLLRQSPDVKNWLNERDQGKWLKLEIELLLIFAFLFVVYWLYWSSLSHSMPAWYFQLMILMFMLIPTHHQVSQIHGLSSTYNSLIRATIELSPKELSEMRRREVLEKRAILTLLATYLLPAALEQKILPLPVSDSVLQIIYYSLYALTTGLFLFIMWNSYRSPKSQKSNKTIYLGRLVLLPLAPLSVIALSSSFLFHGFEYLCVYRKLATASPLANPTRRFWLISFATVVIFSITTMCEPAYVTGFYYSDFTQTPMILQIAATFSAAAITTHYWLDRQMFRMRNPSTRKWIGRILSRPVSTP
jgi:hypothetical protein